MATMNQVGVGLSGESGSGAFVGTTSATLVTPRIGQINDTNGLAILLLTPSSTAVNYIEIQNSAAASPVHFQAVGSDSNITIQYLTKGTGIHALYSAATTNQFVFGTGTAYTHSTTFNFPATSASRTITWPDADGTLLMTGQAISTVPSIAFSSTSGVIGTTTNDNAAAGSVGEYVESVIAFGSAVALTTATGVNVTSISLTAGDWDFWGQINISFTSSTSYTKEAGQISTTNATLVTTGTSAPLTERTHPAVVSGGEILFMPIGSGRLSISGTTTLYLNARATFTVSTANAYGFIAARRRR